MSTKNFVAGEGTSDVDPNDIRNRTIKVGKEMQYASDLIGQMGEKSRRKEEEKRKLKEYELKD